VPVADRCDDVPGGVRLDLVAGPVQQTLSQQVGDDSGAGRVLRTWAVAGHSSRGLVVAVTVT
jgi:hypothetical protein